MNLELLDNVNDNNLGMNLPALCNSALPLPINSIEAYIQQVNNIPLLSKEVEFSLAERMHLENDLQAAQQLILSHLRYVVRVAKSYIGYGLPLADLIQEGTVGLMKAVKRFNPALEIRLVTFAMHWIKAEIHEFVIKNWRIVKVATTKAQRKLFFKLRSLKKDTHWLTREEAKIIANDLGVKTKDVFQMEQRLLANDLSFDLPRDDSDASDDRLKLTCPSQYLEQENTNPELVLEQHGWQELMQDRLQQGLKILDNRSQEIIKKRWLSNTSKATLDELALIFKISKERVRQLEQQALIKLKEIIIASQ